MRHRNHVVLTLIVTQNSDFRTILVPPQPQLLQQKDELKEKRRGLVGLFEKVIGDFLPGLSRRKRHSGDDGRSSKVKDECQLEGRSGKIMAEVPRCWLPPEICSTFGSILNRWKRLTGAPKSSRQLREETGPGS